MSRTTDVRQIWRRFRYGEPIVVVSGLPRSGTSMAMKMLEAGGMALVMDGLREANIDNPKGYFEYEAVKDLDKQHRDDSWLRGARGKAVKIISFLLRNLPPTYNYKILFMNRNLHEIIASQNKMLARRGEVSDLSDERALELFQDHLGKVRAMFRYRPDFQVLDIHYKGVLDNPVNEALRIGHFLGGRLEVEKMAGAVDPTLYRNRAFPDRGVS